MKRIHTTAFICIVLAIWAGMTAKAQLCQPLPTDTVGGIYPSTQLPDMQVGVPYDQVVRWVLPGEVYLDPFWIPLDSFGLYHIQVLPPGISLECPLSAYCTSGPPDSNLLRMCIRLSGTPTAVSPRYPHFDTIAIWGTFATPFPTVAAIVDTLVLPFRTIPAIEVAAAAGNSGISAVQLLPNPSFGAVKVSFTLARAGDVQLDLLDPLGKVIVARELGKMAAGAHAIPLNLPEGVAGLYFVRLMDRNSATQTVLRLQALR